MGSRFTWFNQLFLVAFLICFICSLIPMAEGFSFHRIPPNPVNSKDVTPEEARGRRAFLNVCTSTIVSSIIPSPSAGAIVIPEQKTYSSNARNLDRLSLGDQSGGSVYDNTPKNPAAAKRRAMVGCKVSVARKQAGGYTEKECNTKVLSGETEFMLEALRALDCPTCPYGIKGA